MVRKLPVNALRRAGATVAMVSAVAAASTSLAPTASAATAGCSTTPSFDFTVPVPAGPPALVDFVDPSDGLTDIGIAIVGSDHKYYSYAARFGIDVDGIGQLACLEGTGFDQPGPAVSDQGDQHFVLGSDHSIWERDVVGDTLSAWTKVPGTSSRSGVDAVVSGTRTDIFYVSANATKEVMHQRKVGDQWSTPESLGGATNEVPSVTIGSDGRTHVWVTGLNGRIYVNAGDTGAWSGWQPLSSGASLHAPAAVIGYGPTSSREDVFVTGSNGFLYQATLTDLGSFTGFKQVLFVGTDARLAAASQGTGHMVVMWSGAGGTGVTQFVSGHAGWISPYIPTYLCADCVPVEPPATSGTSSLSPMTSEQSHTAFQNTPHHD